GTRRQHGVGPGGDDADSGGVESFGLLAGGAQIQPDVRRAEDPGEYGGEREAEVDDERLAEQRRLTVERLSEDGNLVEEGNRGVRGGAEAWLGAAELRLVEHARHAFADERDGDAHDDLIEAEPDAEHRHDHGSGHSAEDPDQEADPDRVSV